jgi:hypothetical protein
MRRARPSAELRDLALRAAELTRAGMLDALPGLAARQAAAIEALRAGEEPAATRRDLELALEAERDLHAALSGAREAAGAELARVARGRGAARRYGAGGAPGALDAHG